VADDTPGIAVSPAPSAGGGVSALGDSKTVETRSTAARVVQGDLPASSGATREPEGVWLMVVIPTVSRRASYLGPVVKALLQQVPEEPWDPLYGRIHVQVVNNDKGAHSDFDDAARELGGRATLTFAKGNTKASSGWHSLTNVQRQSEDLAHTLRMAARTGARHVYVVEDDQMLCPNAMLSIQYLIRKAYSYAPDWLALRTSVGFNGVLVKGKDAPSLAGYIEAHKQRRPPDHLFSEWIQRPIGGGDKLAGRDSRAAGRPFFAFRHNILYHVGSQSSLGHESRVITPKCYDTLKDWLQPVEMFHIDQCPHDDVWPCPGGKGDGELQYERGAKQPHASAKVNMVDWTAARLCATACGNPLGVVNLDGSPPKGIENKKTVSRCEELQKLHKVQIGASWGTLSEVGQREWMGLDCDRAFGGR